MKWTIMKKKWIRFLIWASLGLSLVLISYKIHESYENQAFVQQNSPVVRMPIVGRVKGLGTLRSPNKILVWYGGKRYSLVASNKYFRRTAKYESVGVNFDPARDVATLADVAVSEPSFLLLIIFLGGLGLIGHAIYDFRSTIRSQKEGLE